MATSEQAALDRFRETAFPHGATPWRKAEYSVVDLELTGLDPSVHEIVSFACVTVAEGRVRLEDARYGLVRPHRMPDAATIRIHGLRESDLAGAQSLNQALPELVEAITGRVLVAHVAAIETSFLQSALEKRGAHLRNPVVDTARLGVELCRLQRRPLPGDSNSEAGNFAVSSPGLSDLARSLGLPVHRPHHADGDALTTAQVFIALATHLEEFEDPLTVGALQRTGGRSNSPAGPGVLRRLTRRLGL